MSSSRWKILGILLLVVVAVASVGSYVVLNKSIPPSTLSSSSTLSVTQSSTIATSTTLPPVQWITVGQVKSISYYISLLQSNASQPYVQLAIELQRLPDLTNATAVATITYLALNATNPEVKEAFELIMKGGTPDPNDFSYDVPSWNTDLQVLYWLASQNELKKDDTLALAISMVNGLWVTMGNNEVQQAVMRDTNDMLNYGRETSKMQRALDLSYDLESYPLEAKVCWAWTGGESPLYAKLHSLALFLDTRLDLKSYNWDTVSIDSLKKMRSLSSKNQWWSSDTKKTVDTLEDYFYFDNTPGPNFIQSHWTYDTPSENGKIVVEGEEVGNYFFGNINWLLDYYMQNNRVIGVSLDEADWIGALSKSLGIATVPLFIDLEETGPHTSHTLASFYNPSTNEWEVATKQGNMGWWTYPGPKYDLYVFRPPSNQHGYPGIVHYIKDVRYSDVLYPDAAVYGIILQGTDRNQIEAKMQHNSEMKTYLFSA